LNREKRKRESIAKKSAEKKAKAAPKRKQKSDEAPPVAEVANTWPEDEPTADQLEEDTSFFL
ncbi:unnamed protein product, partial [Durusdinium trenchii]